MRCINAVAGADTLRCRPIRYIAAVSAAGQLRVEKRDNLIRSNRPPALYDVVVPPLLLLPVSGRVCCGRTLMSCLHT
jgi:hypothetical protein